MPFIFIHTGIFQILMYPVGIVNSLIRCDIILYVKNYFETFFILKTFVLFPNPALRIV